MSHLITTMIRCFRWKIIGNETKIGHSTKYGKYKKKNVREQRTRSWKLHYEGAHPHRRAISAM